MLSMAPVSRSVTSACLPRMAEIQYVPGAPTTPSITGLEMLDNAAKHGVTVALCIEIGRERLGFDYDDEEAVAAQLEFARNEVMKYKDHPALLTWIIGNEVNLSFKNPKVFDAINDISKMIHELDPNHPTTTALAGFNRQLAKLIETRAPDLDFVSIQMYGDIVNLPRYIKETGYKGPLLRHGMGFHRTLGSWQNSLGCTRRAKQQ